MRIAFILFVSFFLLSCSGEAQIYPDINWATHQNPPEVGWSDSDRRDFTRYIIDSTYITGLVIIHKGQKYLATESQSRREAYV